jgi:hypothetical protein
LCARCAASNFDEALASSPLLFVAFCAAERTPSRCEPFLAQFEQAYGIVLATFPENTRPLLRKVRTTLYLPSAVAAAQRSLRDWPVIMQLADGTAREVCRWMLIRRRRALLYGSG